MGKQLINQLEDTKKCPKCGRELPITEFYKNRKHPDGLQPMCKDCNKAYSRMYYHKRKAMAESGGVKSNYSDPELDGKTKREVMDIMVKCKRWLEARGCTIHLSGKYTEVKQLKF